MKLTYNPQDDARQIRSLTLHLLQSRKGEVISGMSARQLFNKVFGLDIDHHEYAYTLDYMASIGEATYHKYNGGNTQYIIGTVTS